MRRGVLLLVGMSLVAGCTNGASGDTTTSSVAPVTVATTTSTVTTTTAVATTTTVESPSTSVGDIPFPDNAGTDWLRVATELEAFTAWLGENPDPSLVEVVSVPGSADYEWLHRIISEHASNGWHDLPGGGGQVDFAELATGDPDEGFVVLRVVLQSPGSTTVNEAGDVVGLEEATAPGVFTWELEGSPGAGWRVRDSRFVGLVGE